MGSGKGNPEFWVAVVRPGRVLFELAGVAAKRRARSAALAAAKLPIATKIVVRVRRGGSRMKETICGTARSDHRRAADRGPRNEGRTVQPALPAAHRTSLGLQQESRDPPYLRADSNGISEKTARRGTSMEQPNGTRAVRNRRRIKQGRVASEQDGQDDRGRRGDARPASGLQEGRA